MKDALAGGNREGTLASRTSCVPGHGFLYVFTGLSMKGKMVSFYRRSIRDAGRGGRVWRTQAGRSPEWEVGGKRPGAYEGTEGQGSGPQCSKHWEVAPQSLGVHKRELDTQEQKSAHSACYGCI